MACHSLICPATASSISRAFIYLWHPPQIDSFYFWCFWCVRHMACRPVKLLNSSLTCHNTFFQTIFKHTTAACAGSATEQAVCCNVLESSQQNGFFKTNRASSVKPSPVDHVSKIMPIEHSGKCFPDIQNKRNLANQSQTLPVNILKETNMTFIKLLWQDERDIHTISNKLLTNSKSHLLHN